MQQLFQPGDQIVRRDRLPLVIDGEEYQVTARDLSRSHTLAEFLRDHVGTAGREACGEGGCGACAVIVTRPVTDDDGEFGLETCSVASCVTPVGDVALMESLKPSSPFVEPTCRGDPCRAGPLSEQNHNIVSLATPNAASRARRRPS